MSVGYSRSPLFQSIYGKEEDSDVYYSTFNTGGRQRTASVSLGYNNLLGMKGMVNVQLTGSHSCSEANGMSVIDNGWTAFGMLVYSPAPGWNTTLNANYMSASKLPTVKTGAIGSVSADISKSLLGGRLLLMATYGFSPSSKTYVNTYGITTESHPRQSAHMVSCRAIYSLSWGNKRLNIRNTGRGGREERQRM